MNASAELSSLPFFGRARQRERALEALCAVAAKGHLGEDWAAFIETERRQGPPRRVALYRLLCARFHLDDLASLAFVKAELVLGLAGDLNDDCRHLARAAGLAWFARSLPGVMTKDVAADYARKYGASAVAAALAYRNDAPRHLALALSPQFVEQQGRAILHAWIWRYDQHAAGWLKAFQAASPDSVPHEANGAADHAIGFWQTLRDRTAAHK